MDDIRAHNGPYGCMSILLRRVTSLRRRAQVTTQPRRVLDDDGVECPRLNESIVQVVPGGACSAPLRCFKCEFLITHCTAPTHLYCWVAKCCIAGWSLRLGRDMAITKLGSEQEELTDPPVVTLIAQQRSHCFKVEERCRFPYPFLLICFALSVLPIFVPTPSPFISLFAVFYFLDFSHVIITFLFCDDFFRKSFWKA